MNTRNNNESLVRSNSALDLAENCGDTYAAAPDHLKRQLNQALFTQLRVTTNPDGIAIEPNFEPPFGVLFSPDTRSLITEVLLTRRHAAAASARSTQQRKKPVQMDGLQGLAESDPALFSRVIVSTKSTVVEHIGFEPMTSSMPWKRASQLCQCPNAVYSTKKSPPVKGRRFDAAARPPGAT